ncbi:aerobic-type carbon monoxide dehydrogenase small subunit (CoxS/CutS family) [Kibdelosporangium banguiense]|uniref:Aerobic-type carbon monoxide dehydrogenase small subunit (CoxS/CutS family) n=1 Tax=Kibdelosporangium banguiense TaxID=1365924 RepID=A0ABS4T6H2_9PSEU|nr:2Fe-2S iron-sulfur cluster-binding protein [Kibdelosporangium banguiense]MBP2319851.1 aerobic-type carbon monoxide dehydrogenase small subunit (CoxS/CutS family) [Kibdelosporangium banguiense]
MTETFQLTVNGTPVEVTCDRDTPLLFVLRNHLGLKGTKFGCGLGLCGACNVIIDGHSVQSCNTPLWSIAGERVRTIESLGDNKVQQMFIAEQARAMRLLRLRDCHELDCIAGEQSTA